MWDRYLNFNWNIYFFVVDFLYFDWRKVYNEFEIKINYCIYVFDLLFKDYYFFVCFFVLYWK